MKWTVKTLKSHYDQRFIDQDKAVRIAQDAATKAIDKAEAAQEKRLDGMNEFRDALSDQAGTFMPRQEAELRFSTMAEQIARNTSAIDRTGGGVTTGQRMITVLLSIAAILVSTGALIAIILLH